MKKSADTGLNKEQFTLQETIIMTLMRNPEFVSDLEKCIVQQLSTNFSNVNLSIKDAILEELIATRGTVIANAIINSGRFTDAQLELIAKINDQNVILPPEFKQLLELPEDLIKLLLEAITLRKERINTLNEKFIESFTQSHGYPFDIPYQLDSQHRIDISKTIITWLEKHLTQEDVKNNEKTDFNIFQLALAFKDPEFFQKLWDLGGPEVQEKFLNFSVDEPRAFIASAQMGMLWFCELLHEKGTNEQQNAMKREYNYKAFEVASANNRLDVFLWLRKMTSKKNMLIQSDAFSAAAQAGHQEMLKKQWDLAPTKEIKRMLLEKHGFAAFPNAVLSGNLETCELLWTMAEEVEVENDMLMANKGTGSILNLAASEGHLEICKWIISKATAEQAPILFQNMDIRHFPSDRSLSTVALYRWYWNVANSEMRDFILMSGHCAVFKYLLEKGLIPICKLLLNNASEDQRNQMLISGLTFSQYNDAFSLKAYNWAWDYANADQRAQILNELLEKNLSDTFTSVLFASNLKYGQWLWERATPTQQQEILKIVKAVVKDPRHIFGETTSKWISALEESLSKSQHPEGATQTQPAFFHTGKELDNEGKETKLGDEDSLTKK